MSKLAGALAIVVGGLGLVACGGQVLGRMPTEGGTETDAFFDAELSCANDPSLCPPTGGDSEPPQDAFPTPLDGPPYPPPVPEAGPWYLDATPDSFADDGPPYEGPDSGIWLVDATAPVVDPPPIDASSYFGWLSQAFVGTWEGVRTDPWGPPATVVVHFEASGAYSAHCVSPDPACSVWYYGTDADSPAKTYSLYNLNANQTGVATIVIAWDAAGTDTQTGTLQFIAIDPSGTKLSFDFEATWNATTPPAVHFDLQRVGP